MKKVYSLAFGVLCAYGASAQNTFTQVHSLLQTKCSNSTCHSASSADALKFDGTENDVYAALVNVAPGNAAAKTKGDKLVKVNQPYQSYLLRKANFDFDTDLALEANEGDSMASVTPNTPLEKQELELIRQWIMNGATKTGKTVDTALVNGYYRNPANPFLAKPKKPTSGTGKQVRFGPLFVGTSNSAQETEVLLKNEIDFGQDVEIDKIDGFMNLESHHFLLFKFTDSAKAAVQPNGLRIVSLTGGTSSFDGDKQLTASWQDDLEIDLPEGTALFWDKKTYLDFNYHVKNYGATAILPVDFYFNINYQPRGTGAIEMKSKLVNNAALVLPQGNRTAYMNDDDNGANETRYIWSMTSHTHKYGTDFDIFEYDGTQPNKLGNQIYEGLYNYEQGYPLAKYDWEHPSTIYFTPQHPIDYKTSGMRVRTTWNVTEPIVTFGFTTKDEMQLYYYMYTVEMPIAAGLRNVDSKVSSVNIYPNPITGASKLAFDLKENAEVRIYVQDIAGRIVSTLQDGSMAQGNHSLALQAGGKLSKGVYLATINVNGITSTKKFTIVE